jgi:hypothetical protein
MEWNEGISHLLKKREGLHTNATKPFPKLKMDFAYSGGLEVRKLQ